MKILYVITGLAGGGAEKVVVDLADKMAELGHSIKIAYLTGDVVVLPKNLDIEITPLHLNKAANFLSASKLYQKIIKEFQPDIVHAHMVHANLFTRLNRITCAVPRLICTAHSNNEGGRLRMFAYRMTHHLGEITTHVSTSASHTFELLGAVPKGGIRTIYNGIDLSNFYKRHDLNHIKFRKELELATNEQVVLAVGRFHDAKDYPNLLQAFKLFLQDYDSPQLIRLFIVGDGEYKQQIEDMIRDLALQERVKLLGRRNDIAELMSFADYFILSSKYEGFGLVIAEAMACECYVVATDCGGVAEIMGNTGKLVPIQNNQLLANALAEAIDLDANEKRHNNKQGRARVEQLFSLESSVKQWLDIYEK